jgi:hypothetical protein
VISAARERSGRSLRSARYLGAAVIDLEPADRVFRARVMGFGPEGLYFVAQILRSKAA